MFEEQEIVEIGREELLDSVLGRREEGFRLVQIGCTKNEAFQIDYTFDRQYRFLNLRLFLPAEEARLPSITGIFPCAFTYENEIHDLFGIEVQGNRIDYRGNFYRVPIVAPFNVPGKPHGSPPESKE
jgi:ech hydrogenase subunit D